MTELDVLDRFTDGRNDYLEPEIAEQLSSEHRETVDELQLAALLGKTLLEKNGELELKLKRLQEFAEETLVEKQTISRQLCESRDSLQFLNRTCEQLEGKVEELDAANEELHKLCEDRQVLIEEKSAVAHELKEKLESLERENRTLREDLELLQASTKASENVTLPQASATHDSRARRLLSPECDHRQLLRQVTELQEALDQVTLKLQNAHYQRQKLQNELAEYLEENRLLCKDLEKLELENADLQAKLRLNEETSERQLSLESSLSSITSNNRRLRTPISSTSVHSNGFHDHFLLLSPGPEELQPPNAQFDIDGTFGASLFSELDNQCTTLHKQYSDLLRDCTCSASLTHKKRSQLGVSEADSYQTEDRRESIGLTKSEKPFKQLFDEVFATLKQTAQVADRLIERRSSSLDMN